MIVSIFIIQIQPRLLIAVCSRNIAFTENDEYRLNKYADWQNNKGRVSSRPSFWVQRHYSLPIWMVSAHHSAVSRNDELTSAPKRETIMVESRNLPWIGATWMKLDEIVHSKESDKNTIAIVGCEIQNAAEKPFSSHSWSIYRKGLFAAIIPVVRCSPIIQTISIPWQLQTCIDLQCVVCYIWSSWGGNCVHAQETSLSIVLVMVIFIFFVFKCKFCILHLRPYLLLIFSIFFNIPSLHNNSTIW